MKLDETKISSECIYSGKILSLYRDEVLLPDGKKSFRECVRHNDGAAVLLVKDGKVLLVRQFRYLYGREIYEIPAGKSDDGENPDCSALRELKEETGYIAKKLTPLCKIYSSPGFTDETIHIYLAEQFEEGISRPDEGEFLNVEFIPLEKVLEMIERGEICDSKTVAAVYKYVILNK